MDKPSSTFESTAPCAASVHPQHLFILPALTPSHPDRRRDRRDRLTILILADGNRRASPTGGYAGGARRVVFIAEHLARRHDVATMVACILSPDNIAKRSDAFFRELHKEFLELGAAIEMRGALVAANIRLEIWGDLGSLRARGGHAVALADAIEVVAGMTARVAEPALRLILGVGYGPDTAQKLGVDIILRTGMEEPGVIRLSGLRTDDGIINCAVTTLWPDVEPRDMDAILDICRSRPTSNLAHGHEVPMITALLEALSRVEVDVPIRVTIPTADAPREVASTLDRLFAGSLRGCKTIALEHIGADGPAPRRYGPDRGTPIEVQLVGAASLDRLARDESLTAVLAPGQDPPVFRLPGWLSLGSANVHACAATAEGIVRGILAAHRFTSAHPPLLGRDRGSGQDLAAPVCRAIKARGSVGHRDRRGDRFADKTLEWAAEAGLLLPHAAWQTAARNYALTAFFIHFRIPTEWDRAAARWEDRADVAARYMLLVAAGDEGIFDLALDGEPQEQRWARLEASSRFLQNALQQGATRQRPPRIHGAELLAAIARAWRTLFEAYQRSCLPAAAASFRAGLASLYAASLAEQRADLARGLLVRHSTDRARATLIDQRFAAPPGVIAAKARALGGGAPAAGPPTANETLTLLYLAEVASSVGAGLLFQTAALAAPASSVAPRTIRLLDATATLLDHHFRLSNDLSGFLDSPGGDRDPKANACSILVPQTATGAPRAAATIQALVTCRRLAAWTGSELRHRIEHVSRAWPSMGTILQRGVFVGRRVYEVGHYTTISHAEMSAIFDEAEEAMVPRREAVECHAPQGRSSVYEAARAAGGAQ